MIDAVETEIKLVSSPAVLKRMRTHPQLAGAEETANLVTTYFDTDGARLRRGGATLRIRDTGKFCEQTLKLSDPGGSTVRRAEWSVVADGMRPKPETFPPKARAALAQLADGAALETIATTRIVRTSRRLRFMESNIEIAFDVGTIQAGNREEKMCEFELELVEGSLADVVALALTLPIGPKLSWSVVSKAERCHMLAFGIPPAAVMAPPVKLQQKMDVGEGFQAIAWSCLEQVLANYPLVIASGDPEALHQSRVAIRRLRAACAIFGDIVDDDEGAELRAELKAVAGGLGPARDLHVLLGGVEAELNTVEGDFSELLAHLASQRDAATRTAQRLLASKPFQRLLFQFAGWIEGGAWLARKNETGGNRPLKPFAAHVLTQRRKKLFKSPKDVADLSDSARHRLRIDGKKLRCAVSFFAPLYRSKAAAKPRRDFDQELKKLQDNLGELNDMVVAVAAQGTLFSGFDPINGARLRAQLDGLLATNASSRRRLLKKAERSLSRLMDIPAWWKAV